MLDRFRISKFYSVSSLREIADRAEQDYILIYTTNMPVINGNGTEKRYLDIACNTGSVMLYSDFNELDGGVLAYHPLIMCQKGSLRDDFDFGHLMVIRTDAFKEALGTIKSEFDYAGFYALRLAISRLGDIFHIPEPLYTVDVSGNKTVDTHFAYVDPRNRDVQIEMEQACTDHLKKLGGFLHPVVNEISFEENFTTDISVIIPVKNRVKTIPDAVESVMRQKFAGKYNVIIVDNHSGDGTTDVLKGLNKKYSGLIHIIPEEKDLGIGGCWNKAVLHPGCGKFCIQLDSDDLYSGDDVLQKVWNKFQEGKCAMVVGSYSIVDFDLNTMPPGLIDHREWTDENGHNNALRINGLGAPRAFYTPVIRKILFPNVSYGEDYAVALAISRSHKVGRIYESLYLCRRWEGNTDSGLPQEKINRNNLYKDTLRSMELSARQKINGYDGKRN